MAILILSARPETASNRRLAETATSSGVGVEIVDATAVVASTDGELRFGDRRITAEPSSVVLARVGNWRPESLLAQLEVLTARGVPTPNPAPAIRIGRDHWLTVQLLEQAGLPVPLTVAGADPEVLAAVAADRLGFPVVVKQRRSRMGVGVIRCNGIDHLEAVLDSLWRVGDEIAVQRYVETKGSSIRLFVVGGEVVAAARFVAVGDEWRSNSARGGRAEAMQPDRTMIDLATRAAAAAGLGICGVDLLPGDSGVMVGELNPTPGFGGLETATGVDVAAAVVDHLVSLQR